MRAGRVLVLVGLLLSALLAGTFPSAQANANPARSGPPQMTSGAQVSTYLVKHHFRGYILLVRRGHTLLARGYGVAAPRTNALITAQTRWPMLSVESPMIAIAILKLQEGGKLSVRDRVCRYLAGCPSAWRTTTIQDMLDGASRIGRFDPFTATGTVQRSVTACMQVPMLAAPAGVSEDSPCNRIVLSVVIARVSGKSFATYMQQTIFRPAGMTSTAAVGQSPANSARGYAFGTPTTPLHLGGYPLVYSTSGDLERMDRALLADKLISMSSVASLIAPYRYDDPTNPSVKVFDGLGWQVLKANQYFFGSIGKTGMGIKTNRVVYQGQDQGISWSGFHIDDYVSPDDGAVEVWLSNDKSVFTTDDENQFQDRIVKLMWGQ